MNAKFRNSMLALALFGGTALFAASGLATDMNEGDFGGTYRYIGPGAASEPDIYVGPFSVPTRHTFTRPKSTRQRPMPRLTSAARGDRGLYRAA